MSDRTDRKTQHRHYTAAPGIVCNLVLAGAKSNFQAFLHSDSMHFSVIGLLMYLAAVGVLSEWEALESPGKSSFPPLGVWRGNFNALLTARREAASQTQISGLRIAVMVSTLLEQRSYIFHHVHTRTHPRALSEAETDRWDFKKICTVLFFLLLFLIV